MNPLTLAAPPIEAFVVAGAAIYLDCYQTTRKQMVRVPRQVLDAPGVLALAGAVGLVAVGIFFYTSWKLKAGGANSPLDTILSLKIDDPYLRAPYVGLLTLAIIRSKLLDLKNAPFGVEYIYTEGRLRALVPGITRWSGWRNQFIANNKAAAFAYPNYFVELDDALDAAAKLEESPSETARALEEVRKTRPATAPAPADASWDLYYRTLTRLALDTLSPSVFRGKPGF